MSEIRRGVPSVALSDRSVEISLSDAVYLGVRQNRSLRGAYIQRTAQKFDLLVAEDRFSPKVVVSGRQRAARADSERYRLGEVSTSSTLLTPYGTRLSLGWNGNSRTSDTRGRDSADGANFSLVQPLLRGMGAEVGTAPVRQARLAEQANRLELKRQVSLTVMRITVAYRELLRAQEQLQNARNALERSRELRAANQALIAAGRMAEVDIVQTEADIAVQELSVVEAENQLDASRQELLLLLALDGATQIRASDDLAPQRVQVSAVDALRQAEAFQPGYLMRFIAVEQARINLATSRNDRLWDISLVGGATQAGSRQSSRTGPDSARNWEGYVGVQIEIPIGDLALRQAEVRARTALQALENQLEDARQVLRRDVMAAVRDLDARWRQYELAQRVMALSQQKLRIEREKLNAGRSSNFQVLGFVEDLRTAESMRLNALITYMNAQTHLDDVAGVILDNWDISLND